MYCKNCGKEIDDNAVICIHCGVAQKKVEEIKDNGGIAWNLLGFCLPVASLVLYLAWKDEKPKNAKAVGIGGLIFLGVMALFFVFAFVMGLVSAI